MFLIKPFSTLTLDDFKSYDVISFDIFDTVLTRNVYRPADVFLRLQHRLSGMFPDELFHPSFDLFHRLRIHAEKSARKLHRNREDVTLKDIAHTFGLLNGVDEHLLLALYEQEVSEEFSAVSPIVQTIELIAALRQAGKRIIFISDMYLPNSVICRLLEKVGAYRDVDIVYVSGEAGLTKASGRLFQLVLDDLGISSSQIAHVGDYIWSDYIVPRLKYGIRSKYFYYAKPNRNERTWGDGCRCMYCSSVAGASRVARLSIPPGRHSTEKALFEIGCNVVGPILTSFVLWVLQQAKLLEIRRLYFFSRDGEIMLHIAQRLAQQYGLEIDLRYLHVSRTSVLPSLAGLNLANVSVEWIKEDNIVLTLRIIAARIKTEPEHLKLALADVGLTIARIDDPLGQVMVDRICSLLQSYSVLNGMFVKCGTDTLTALTDYLEQAGFFEGTPFAVVDLGWKGSIQDALLTCFDERLGGEITGFYFGLVRTGNEKNRKHAYLFHPNGEGPYYHFRELFTILTELFCASAHGMVKGFVKNHACEVIPEFFSIEDSVNSLRIPIVREGVNAFVDNLDIFPDDVEPLHVRKQVLRLLRRFFTTPTRSEADALGEYRFSGDQSRHNVHVVAPAFTCTMALKYLTKSSYAERSTISSWFFGSWARSCPLSRIILLPVVVLFRLLNLAPNSCAASIYGIVNGYSGFVKMINKILKENNDSGTTHDNN
jgi:FMN phosphatase YigB (HAD superfamily)